MLYKVTKFSELPEAEQKLRNIFAGRAFSHTTLMTDYDLAGDVNISINRICGSLRKLDETSIGTTVREIFSKKKAGPIIDELKPILCALIAKPE